MFPTFFKKSPVRQLNSIRPVSRRTLIANRVERLEDRTMLSAAPFFTGVGDLPGGDFFSPAHGVSNDGTVVVGRSINADGLLEAYRWTQARGMEPLGFVEGASESYGNSVTYDGSTIVGYSPNGSTSGYVWTAADGMTPLPTLPGDTSSGGSAFDITSDGAVIAGYSSFGGPIVWRKEVGPTGTQYAPQGLGSLPSSSGGGLAYGVSDDGTVAVGYAIDANGVAEAFRWTQATGMVGLGALGDGGGRNLDSRALRVSADGNVIVGQSQTAQKVRGSYVNEAFRWTQATGMVGLGDLPGGAVSSRAAAVSGDGSYIVGRSSTDAGNEAFIWDAVHGMRSLQHVLATDYQLDLTGWQLTHVVDLTADGLTMVGEGINPQGSEEGWIAHLGTTSPQPGISVTPTSGLETTEDGITASFSIVLDTEPTAPVTVAVSSADESEGTIVGATNGIVTLTFDVANWNVPQIVTVQGADDTDQDGEQAYTIQLAPAVSADQDYNGLDPADVSVTNLDNEVPPASPNDIYVWNIDLQTRLRRGRTEGRIVIDIRNDWNANGVDSFDTGAQNVLVTVTLAGPAGTTTYSGYTDSTGVFRSGWISGLASGDYTVELIDLAHATFDWNRLLDPNGDDGDADGDGFPDDIFALP